MAQGCGNTAPAPALTPNPPATNDFSTGTPSYEIDPMKFFPEPA
ncbi:hypothetical protein BN2497_1427 [Janthinobacterium sp. CG23_2]|nr:hypothetical protein BN2497_1427 [Janthinobacterium sp. CG23_2]CUU27111.1 hypothetical protein BN3177_1427 [Janthinobacterium sp. CG23_2]